eukprot:scaffold8044_cov632-Prasinococcus_capsulatus_cf.AAC.1
MECLLELKAPCCWAMGAAGIVSPAAKVLSLSFGKLLAYHCLPRSTLANGSIGCRRGRRKRRGAE